MRTIKNIVAVLSLASLLLLLFEFRIAFIGLIIFTGLWLFLDSYDKIEEDYELDDIINAKNIATNSIYGLTSVKFDNVVKDPRDTFDGYTFSYKEDEDGQRINGEHTGTYEDYKAEELPCRYK